MRIDIVSLFPEMFPGVLNTSIIGRAQTTGAVRIAVHQLRDWTTDKHKTVDDTPYGGGAGMVIKVDVIDRALHDLKSKINHRRGGVPLRRENHKAKLQGKIQKMPDPYVILLTPQGKPLTQRLVEKMAKKRHLILVAGHYEGFDERVRALVDEEISIGDYILTGGELPAMVLTDAVTRLLPGVLGNKSSTKEESFAELRIKNQESRILEYPHYTRPDSYLPTSILRKRPLTVPKILKSGHHTQIAAWRRTQAAARTQKRRPDLIEA